MEGYVIDRHDHSKRHDVCAGRLSLLGDIEVTEWLTELPAWSVADQRLKHTFECESFERSTEFIVKIAEISAMLNHHPDICLHGKKSVRVTLWTRQLGGLTSLDFDLAAAVDAAFWAEFGKAEAR